MSKGKKKKKDLLKTCCFFHDEAANTENSNYLVQSGAAGLEHAMTTCFLFQSLFCTRTQFKGSCNACICKHAALAATRFADESQGQSRRALLPAGAGVAAGGSAPPSAGCPGADVPVAQRPGSPQGWVTAPRGPQKSWHVQKNGVLEKQKKEKAKKKERKKNHSKKMCVTADYFRPWSMHNANKQLPGYMPVKTIQSHSTRV